ncbi:fibronectin type III domain-containing protein, partial [bacterium]|nr:fibronectin type III domain-containing protein [bacterium]
MQVTKEIKRKSSMAKFQKMQPARSRIRSLCLLGLIVFSTAVWAGAIKVKWNANSEPDLAGYRVHVGESSGVYTKIIDVGDTTEHVITGAEYAKTYYVGVSAYDDSGNESELSTEVSITLKAPGIRAVRSAHGLLLSWQRVAGADSYEIFRDADPYFIADQPFVLTPDTTFLDDTFVPVRDVGVYYQVVALRNGATIFAFSRIGGYTVYLAKGINLISLPLIPDSAGVNNVLGDQLTGGSSKASSDYVMIYKEQN